MIYSPAAGNAAFKQLKTCGFRVLSRETVPALNRNFERIAAQRPSGLMINPRSGEMIISKLKTICQENDIPTNDISSPDNLEPVQCSLFEPIKNNHWDTIWSRNIFPVMGDGIYNNVGTLLKAAELERANLRQVMDAHGNPVKLSGFITGNRVVSIPGPWIVPFVQTDNGIRIIKTKAELEELAGVPLRNDQIDSTIKRLYINGKLHINLASDLQFKGSGCAHFEWNKFPEFEGKSIYMPATPFRQTRNDLNRGFLWDGVGATSSIEHSSFAIEEGMRRLGAMFSANTVSTKKIFDKRNFPELRKQKEYNEVSMVMRLSENTYRMGLFISDFFGPEVPLMFMGCSYFGLYTQELFGEQDPDVARDLYFSLAFSNLARNIRASLPSLVRRTEASNITDNWSPECEMTDSNSLRPRKNKRYHKEYSEFIRQWNKPWLFLSLLFHGGLGLYANEGYMVQSPYFYQHFLPAIFNDPVKRNAIEKQIRDCAYKGAGIIRYICDKLKEA